MAGMEEKLLVPFRARYSEIHQASSQIQIAHGGLISITIWTPPV